MSEAAELRRTHAISTRGSAELRRNALATLMPGFAGLTAPGWVTAAFDKGLVSVCVYGENVRDAEQLRALGAELRTSRPDALIAIDEEGGEVTRLHYLEGSPYPGAAVLGRIDDVDYTEEIGERVGRDILASGFNLALGPIADVNSNPLNPVIGTRSFAADPDVAARHVAAFTRGLQRTGALACAKHFPGHGDTAQDSHLALPTVDVKGRNVVLLDDVASSGHTLAEATRLLLAAGASRVDVAVTHALFADEALQLVRTAGVSEVWSTDCIAHSTNTVSMASAIAAALTH